MEEIEIKNRIKNALKLLDFSEEQMESQLKKIDEIIVNTLLNKILEENPDNNKEILTDPNKYLSTHYTDEQLNQMLEEEGIKVLKPYFNEITAGLDEEKKKAFFDSLYY